MLHVDSMVDPASDRKKLMYSYVIPEISNAMEAVKSQAPARPLNYVGLLKHLDAISTI